MNIFVDDNYDRYELLKLLRRIPEDTTHIGNFTQAIDSLVTNKRIERLYLDGDLKDYNGDGLDLVRFLTEEGIQVETVYVHSLDDRLSLQMINHLRSKGYLVERMDLMASHRS